MLEDKVLRGVEGVDGPVLGFDCGVGQYVFILIRIVKGIGDVVGIALIYLRGSCSGLRS